MALVYVRVDIKVIIIRYYAKSAIIYRDNVIFNAL